MGCAASTPTNESETAVIVVESKADADKAARRLSRAAIKEKSTEIGKPQSKRREDVHEIPG
ncbi:hypothetical protein DIPPA_31310 [Diplonema papillatum]|nr:hypothetical protein DIPPA_31310 [Diplonema papillatum]